MWIVFKVISIGEMKPISNALETVEDAISFRQTMLEGTLYKNSNLVYSYVGKVLRSEQRSLFEDTQPRKLYHCTSNIEAIEKTGVLWGNSIGDYSKDSARRTFLSEVPITSYGAITIEVNCSNYRVVDMGNREYIVNTPIAFHQDCKII